MIEKKLKEVFEDKQYILSSWKSVIEKCQKTIKNESVEECWNTFIKNLIADQTMTVFWNDIGYPINENLDSIVTILESLKYNIMTSVLYLGIDFIFDEESKDDNGDVGFEHLNRDYIRSIFPHCDDKDSMLTSEEIYDGIRHSFDTFFNNTSKINNPLQNNDKSMDAIRWKYGLETRQLGYTITGVCKSIPEPANSFFPEIDFYISQAFGNLKKHQFSNVAKEATQSQKIYPYRFFDIEKGLVQVHSLCRLLPYIILKATSFLPGHKNTKAGRWTLYSINAIDELLKECVTTESSVLSYDTDNSEIEYFLTLFATEDLFHINRLNFSLKKYLNVITTYFPELNENEYKDIALMFSTLLYLPPGKIQEYVFKEIFDTALHYVAREESTKEKCLQQMKRTLAICNIIVPSLLCGFAHIVFNSSLNKNMVKNRTKQLMPVLKAYLGERDNYEEILLCNDGLRVWKDNHFFREYVETKRKDGKGKRSNYTFSDSITCSISCENLLDIFMNQSPHSWRNTSIIMEGKKLSSLLSELKVKDKDVCIYDMQQNYLKFLVQAFLNEIEAFD